jgi:hypothetical protein
VKADNGIIHYASKSDYLKRRPELVKKMAQKSVEEGLVASAKEAPGALKESVSLSEEAKANGIKPEKLKDQVKKEASKVPEQIKEKVIEGKNAGTHLLTQAGSAVLRAVSGGALPGVSLPSFSSSPSAPATVQSSPGAKKIDGAEEMVNKPGIFFIRGFSLNPFENNEEGLGAMSANIPSSHVFSWSDGDSVIEEVKKRPPDQPIILVGHGMGGDTAVDIANRLNAVENGFRRVDLLVTLDSVGTDNDIIPQNVRENYNLISDQDFLLNDGPNIARKKNMTKVTNELLEANHDELEKSPEIQFLVYEKINRTLMNAIAVRDFKAALGEKILASHRLPPKGARLSLA